MRANCHLAISVACALILLVACVPAGPPQPTAAPAKVPTSAATSMPKIEPTATPAAPKIKRGGNVVLSEGNPATILDPIMATSSTPLIELPIFNALLRWDLKDPKTGKHDFGPELAESWQITDPKTVVLKLQKGVKFHDGSDFNAEVAKWNLDRVLTHPKSLGKALTGAISSVDIVDPFTVKLNLKQPSATILNGLTNATGGTGSSATLMVSKQAVEKMGEEAFGNKAIASGPMQVVEWRRDDRIVLKKWDGYWKKGADGQPLPYVDGITSRDIVDPAVALVEVRAGTVHITRSVDTKDIAGVKANPELVFVSMPWASSFYTFGLNPRREPWKSSQKVRWALQYALDRPSIAKTIGLDEGQPQYYPTWNAAFPGYDESVFKFEFNLDKASAMMKEAGLANGVDVALVGDTRTGHQRVLEIMQAMWSKANIRAKVEIYDSAARKAKVLADEFDAESDIMSPSPDPDMYTRWLGCDGASNWNKYCNSEVDKCLAEGRSTYDQKERDQIYRRCLKIINEDAFVAGTFMMPVNYVYRKEIKGVRFQGGLIDLQEVWIDK